MPSSSNEKFSKTSSALAEILSNEGTESCHCHCTSRTLLGGRGLDHHVGRMAVYRLACAPWILPCSPGPIQYIVSLSASTAETGYIHKTPKATATITILPARNSTHINDTLCLVHSFRIPARQPGSGTKIRVTPWIGFIKERCFSIELQCTLQTLCDTVAACPSAADVVECGTHAIEIPSRLSRLVCHRWETRCC